MAIEKKFGVNINVTGNKVVGIADGVDASDAINKSQLDSQNTELTSYIDNKILGLGQFMDDLDPASGLPTVGSGAAGAIDLGDYWAFSKDGTILDVDVHAGSYLRATVNNPDTTNNTASNTDFKIVDVSHDGLHPYDITNLSLLAEQPHTIAHNLGYKFVKTVFVTSDNKPVELDVEYIDNDNINVTSADNVVINGSISR